MAHKSLARQFAHGARSPSSSEEFDAANRSARGVATRYDDRMDNSNIASPSAIAQLRYSIAPIDTELAERIRRTLRDDHGNQLAVWVSGYSAPCRHCLRRAPAGTALIVFAYSPFSTKGPYAEVGPVFIHADACQRYDGGGRFPSDYMDRILTMRGYNDRGTIEDAQLSQAGDPETTIDALFADERVRFIHVRNPAWGCFHFRVDRA